MVDEMTWLVMELAFKSTDLCLSPTMHMVDGENKLRHTVN